MIFSGYIIAYLFAAGVGSGAFLVASVCYLLNDIRPTRSRAMLLRDVRSGFFLAPCFTLLSTFFLALDLGNLERVWRIALTPFASAISIGAWSIGLLFVVSVVFLICRIRFASPALMRVLCVLGCLLSLLVMGYSGYFLSSMKAIHLWNTPWLVALFMMSSVSMGHAVCILVAALTVTTKWYASPSLMKSALFVSVLELLILVCFIFSRIDFSLGLATSCVNMLFGKCAITFWVGVIGLGFAVPLVCHVGARFCGIAERHVSAIILSAGTLVGGLALRYSIVASAVAPSLLLGLYM